MANPLFLAGLVLCVGLSAGPPLASGSREGGDAPLGPVLIRETVEALGTALDRDYFDPAVAAKVADALHKHLAEGRYQRVSTAEALAKALTDDLFAMTGDKHLAISPIVRTPSGPAAAAAVDDTSREVVSRRMNFGVQRVEILPGNVGYLNLTAFYRPDEAREAIAAAMATLGHADALILDLRQNQGGSSGTFALMASYFFEDSGLPLFEVVPRPPAKATHFATVVGPLPNRNHQRPTYVLTSENTWSGGEGLAFILQERHRAEVIGQTTAGAGNQARTYPITDRFEATIPNGFVRSAVPHQSWEGTGVVPDIPAAPADALRVAHLCAIRRLMRAFPQGPWHDALAQHLASLEAPGK